MSVPKWQISKLIDFTEFQSGWRILLLSTCGLLITATGSFLYAFGTLTIPLQKALGWSRADIQPGLSCLFIGTIVAVQAVGWLNKRWGMRRVTMSSLIVMSAVLALMPAIVTAHGLKSFYAMCFLLPIAGLGTTPITWSNLVGCWFDRSRGLALALMLSGSGLAALIAPVAVTFAIQGWGWKAAFWVLASLPIGLAFPLAVWCMKLPQQTEMSHQARDKNASGDDGIPFSHAIRSARFWAICLAVALPVGVTVPLIGSMVPLLRDKGLSAIVASQVFGSWGISLVAGRLVVGYLFDRFWAPGIAALALTMPALGCFLLLDANHIGSLTFGVVLVATGAGAELDIATYLVARYFGMRDFGRTFGVQFSIATASAAVAPVVSGGLYAATGSYGGMLMGCGVAFAIAGIILLSLGRYPKFGSVPNLTRRAEAL